MTLNYKLARFYTANSSWFRIMINGKQFIPSQVPNSLNSDPFTTTNFDLSAFVGGIVNIELQHSGRRTTFTSNGINDAAYVSLIEFSGTLGNEDFSKNHFKIYPNPFTNSIIVETEIPSSIEMYDVLGKKIDATQTTNTINTSKWNSGIYFLKLKKANGQEFIRKVIKN